MSSTQPLTRQSQASSATSSPSAKRTLVFLGVSYREDDRKILRELRNQYPGVESVSRASLRNDHGESTNAIRIDFKSDNFAAELLKKGAIQISNTPYSIHSSTQSVFVSKIIANDKTKLLQDLNHNYLGVEDVARFLDINGNPVDLLRIDFKLAASPTKILKDNYILIDGKRRPVQTFSSLVEDASQKEEETVTETPQQSSRKNSSKPANDQSQKPVNSYWQKPTKGQSEKPVTEQPSRYLTEQRVKELFHQQQMQLESIINEFENKWNARLISLSTGSANGQVDQLSPVLKELTTVCQQFSQQNAQMQRQLGTVVNQVQNVQTNLNHEPNGQIWPPLSSQNGH